MNVLTILGTRPEIIRLSKIIPKLDRVCNHRVLHTGQNYDPNLNEIFFSQLELRLPDVVLQSRGTLSDQISSIFYGVEKEILENKPDKVLVLGDTNSGLSTIIAERLGVPVFHMEAGNRCDDVSVPEEINRKIIDHAATYNLPYTFGSRDNLLRENINPRNILVCGNPIFEVLEHYKCKINSLTEDYMINFLLEKQYSNLKNIDFNNFCLVTCHRAETVNSEERLLSVIESLKEIAKETGVIFSCHPKTKNRIDQFGIDTGNIIIIQPISLFEFIWLEKRAKFLITDSGTVLEEGIIFNKQILTIRNSTERPEAVEAGLNIVCGTNKDDILSAYYVIKSREICGTMPVGYNVPNVSDIVVNYILGKGK